MTAINLEIANPVRALIWMIGAMISICVMAIGARELAGHMQTPQILFIRSALGLLIISLLIARKPGVELFKTQRLKLHTVRNLFHFAGQYGWFLGIGLLPLSEVFALEFTVPIWTVIIAMLYLKEAITLRKVCALLLGAAGVLVILEVGLESVQPMALVVLLAALCYAASHVATKGLANTEHPLTVLFYMCLIQLPVSALMSLNSWVTPALALWFWLIVVSVMALTGHYCITQAMRSADAGVVVTLDFLRLPLIALIGVVAYAEPFEISLLFGAGLMLLGNLINIYRPQRPPPSAAVVAE